MSENHVTRMINEKSELATRLRKLENFMDSEQYATLNKFQKFLMEKQRSAMSQYLDILTARIASDTFVMSNSQMKEEENVVADESAEHN